MEKESREKKIREWLNTALTFVTVIVLVLGVFKVNELVLDFNELKASKVVSPIYVIGNGTNKTASMYWNGTCLIVQGPTSGVNIC